jgi:hypothetical protein
MSSSSFTTYRISSNPQGTLTTFIHDIHGMLFNESIGILVDCFTTEKYLSMHDKKGTCIVFRYIAEFCRRSCWNGVKWKNCMQCLWHQVKTRMCWKWQVVIDNTEHDHDHIRNHVYVLIRDKNHLHDIRTFYSSLTKHFDRSNVHNKGHHVVVFLHWWCRSIDMS